MAFDKGYALVIGVGSYNYIPYANIPISVADAKAVKDLLCDSKFCGYLPEHVILLHDTDASRDGILNALALLAEKTTEDNTVLIFYCGHGDYGTDGNYYITTSDTKVSDNKILKGTGISDVELLDKLRLIPVKRLIMFFNSCHSGEIYPEFSIGEQEKSFGDTSLPTITSEAILSSGEGRIIITACRPEQKSWIGKGKLSIFTQSLVNGLMGKGYVPNNRGYVSVFALYEHVYFSVKETVAKLGKSQEVELTILKGVGPFPVSLYMGASDLSTFDTQESLLKNTATREIPTERSKRLFNQITKNLTVTASGERSVSMQGTFTDVTIITGDKNIK